MNDKNKLISLISNIISKDNYTGNRLNDLRENLAQYLELNNQEIYNTIDLINAVTNNRMHQEFLGAIFLRFYKNHENLIEDENNIKYRIISLFDAIYEHSIYKKKNISTKTQNHEKLPLLKHYIEEIESSMGTLNLDNLSNFNSFRQKYLKSIKSHDYIVKFFLHENIYNDLENIFKEIDTYIKNSDIQTYNNLINKLEEDTLILKEINSEYNDLFLLTPLTEIIDLIKQDFSVNNPEAKISKLKISSTGKRYPLSKQDTKIDLFIKLTNEEEGKAYETYIEVLHTNCLVINKSKQYIGTIDGKKIVRVKFDAILKDINDLLSVKVKVTWKDFTQKEYSILKDLTFNSQRMDIDWDKFKASECYSREAIENENELIGRKDILDELFNGLDKNKNIKSYYIHGQKRIGKTSIAKVLKERLDKNKEKFLVLYIEGGEYVDGEDFRNTVNNLGTKICKQISRANPKLSHLNIPSFNGSLQPLVDFLDDVTYILENFKIVFMLDEFDEISSNLYKRNEIGNAFFLTIRSISNKPNYSFILIGGEKINFIISIQGEQLNKFKSHRVDYFDKEHWSEFKDLVKKPVENYLDITDEAINLLYEVTAGNPFFTNVICETMMEIAIEKRDSFITDVEMDEAIKKSVETAEAQIFSHFWEDGIKEDNDKEEEISYKRRKVLLALSELERNNENLTKEKIADKLIGELPELEIKNILKEFTDRTILNENDSRYTFRINFFKDWLLDGGSKKIILTLSDEEKIRIREREEKKAEITSTELLQLIESKKVIYNGNPISVDEVRRWLNQFDSNINQRLVFKILQNLHYYSSANIKIKMKEIFSHVKTKKYEGKTRVSNVLVSYLDSVGKSGVEYSKYFIDENSILQKNSTEKNKILERLNNYSFDYLVFVDDFMGTGQTIIDFVKELQKAFPDIFKKEIEIIIGVVSGFLNAKELVEKEFEKMKINNIKIIICDPLNESDKCFSDESTIYTNPDDRRNTRDICWEKGHYLVSNNPLGFGDCQSTVVFPDTCPNNSLPILWAEQKDFKPLFKRKIN